MKTRKDNKGFSLVELIVVVLIMAILGVALTPQVMKWVENSRISADKNAAGNLKVATQAALAEFQGKGGKLAVAKYTIDDDDEVTVTTDLTVGTGASAITLSSLINSALGGETYATQYNPDASSGFTIDIDANGKVEVTCDASGVDL